MRHPSKLRARNIRRRAKRSAKSLASRLGVDWFMTSHPAGKRPGQPQRAIMKAVRAVHEVVRLCQEYHASPARWAAARMASTPPPPGTITVEINRGGDHDPAAIRKLFAEINQQSAPPAPPSPSTPTG